MGRGFRFVAVTLVLGMGLGIAAGQELTPVRPGENPAAEDANPAATPQLDLSQAQKNAIYTSISYQKQNETAPPTFRAAVGAIVPISVTLKPLPNILTELAPNVKDYHYAMIANQVLLVDPKSRQVVEIINH